MTTPATGAPPAPSAPRPYLPNRGVARVKNVLSGDTAILLGKPPAGQTKAPEVVFTLESISAPRMASKANNNIDEPGAFPAREYLRELLVGKSVSFEVRRQGASAGDRVYGLLFLAPEGSSEPVNVAVQAVQLGHANIKIPTRDPEEEEGGYETELQNAFNAAKEKKLGIHGDAPLVRNLRSAGDGFATLSLVDYAQKAGKIKCIIEYVFDGSRFRVQVVEEGEMQYASFTLLLAGITSPKMAKADGSTQTEPFAEEARAFCELRVLQRKLEITLHGTDKSGICAVGTVHHPKGNIAVELLKNGLARLSDWSVRLMNPLDVPALRVAEVNAKRTHLGIWHSYQPKALTGASEVHGTVVEVLTGDTLCLLPSGSDYSSEDSLQKLSLASIRAPRVGNERLGRADEPFSHECKDRLRVLTVGKAVKAQIHYERDIPMGDTTEKRQFGTISVGKRADVGEVLVQEGLAATQHHRDDDETSPRYDELRAAEATAKAAKKGIHSDQEYKRGAINDLTDPRKAKAYSGSLMRAGTLRGIVEYVFNGARFKMYIPSENCHIIFAPNYLRCPQPSPTPGSRQGKVAEPFGDESKRHARLTILQRSVEIICSGVSMGGVILGQIFVGQGGQRRDYSLEIVGAGLATVDQRKIDYGEAPKNLIDAQSAAQQNKVGLWSIQQKVEEKKPRTMEKMQESLLTVRLSEIRSGNHFFFIEKGSESVKVIEDSMKQFTETNGTSGAPCDVKVGKVVAALFDDGNGKSWYRAKVVEKKGPYKAAVVFLDHGNVSTVPVSSHLRPLDVSLGIDRIPAVAKEASLALTVVRSLDTDEGIDAARMLQRLCWGKDLTVRTHAPDESGKLAVTILGEGGGESINEQLVSAGLARVAKQEAVDTIVERLVGGDSVTKLAADMEIAQTAARKSRSGMWRYGDIGDDDEEM